MLSSHDAWYMLGLRGRGRLTFIANNTFWWGPFMCPELSQGLVGMSSHKTRRCLLLSGQHYGQPCRKNPTITQVIW